MKAVKSDAGNEQSLRHSFWRLSSRIWLIMWTSTATVNECSFEEEVYPSAEQRVDTLEKEARQEASRVKSHSTLICVRLCDIAKRPCLPQPLVYIDFDLPRLATDEQVEVSDLFTEMIVSRCSLRDFQDLAQSCKFGNVGLTSSFYLTTKFLRYPAAQLRVRW